MFERVLSGVVKVTRSALDLETISRRGGALQRFDPRFVFLLLVSLVVVVVMLRNPLSFLLVIAFAITLAFLSRVPLGWYLRRVWLFVPLFTVVILLPSMTSLITPGEAVGWTLQMGSIDIYFTRQGLEYALTFTLRVGAAVSLSVLLVATVEWSKLMRALAQLRFPSSFIVILDMTYRYIHLLLDTVANMFLARKSRMVGKLTARETKAVGSSTVANLFHKSYQMSEQVYLAMLSRGYTGNPKMLTQFKSKGTDYGFAAVMVLFGATMVFFDIAEAQDILHSLISSLGALI